MFIQFLLYDMPYTYKILQITMCNLLATNSLKPWMKVELLDTTSQVPCTSGLVCGVVGMMIHHAPIALGTCTIVFQLSIRGQLNCHFQIQPKPR